MMKTKVRSIDHVYKL